MSFKLFLGILLLVMIQTTRISHNTEPEESHELFKSFALGFGAAKAQGAL